MKRILIAAAIIAGLFGSVQAEGMALKGLEVLANVAAADNATMPEPRPAAPAGQDTLFTADAAWTLGKPVVTDLKRLGVMKAAEKAAIFRCRASGLSGCVVVSSRITNWDHFTLTASAAARPLAPAAKEVFAADNRWTVPGRGFSELERLGVLKDAEDAAVDKCKKAGHLACFAGDSELVSCDKYSCVAAAVALPFKTAD